MTSGDYDRLIDVYERMVSSQNRVIEMISKRMMKLENDLLKKQGLEIEEKQNKLKYPEQECKMIKLISKRSNQE